MPRAVLLGLGMGHAPQSVGSHHPSPQHVSQLPRHVSSHHSVQLWCSFLHLQRRGLQKHNRNGFSLESTIVQT